MYVIQLSYSKFNEYHAINAAVPHYREQGVLCFTYTDEFEATEYIDDFKSWLYVEDELYF